MEDLKLSLKRRLRRTQTQSKCIFSLPVCALSVNVGWKLSFQEEKLLQSSISQSILEEYCLRFKGLVHTEAAADCLISSWSLHLWSSSSSQPARLAWQKRITLVQQHVVIREPLNACLTPNTDNNEESWTQRLLQVQDWRTWLCCEESTH